MLTPSNTKHCREGTDRKTPFKSGPSEKLERTGKLPGAEQKMLVAHNFCKSVEVRAADKGMQRGVQEDSWPRGEFLTRFTRGYLSRSS